MIKIAQHLPRLVAIPSLSNPGFSSVGNHYVTASVLTDMLPAFKSNQPLAKALLKVSDSMDANLYIHVNFRSDQLNFALDFSTTKQSFNDIVLLIQRSAAPVAKALTFKPIYNTRSPYPPYALLVGSDHQTKIWIRDKATPYPLSSFAHDAMFVQLYDDWETDKTPIQLDGAASPEFVDFCRTNRLLICHRDSTPHLLYSLLSYPTWFPPAPRIVKKAEAQFTDWLTKAPEGVEGPSYKLIMHLFKSYADTPTPAYLHQVHYLYSLVSQTDAKDRIMLLDACAYFYTCKRSSTPLTFDQFRYLRQSKFDLKKMNPHFLRSISSSIQMLNGRVGTPFYAYLHHLDHLCDLPIPPKQHDQFVRDLADVLRACYPGITPNPAVAKRFEGVSHIYLSIYLLIEAISSVVESDMQTNEGVRKLAAQIKQKVSSKLDALDPLLQRQEQLDRLFDPTGRQKLFRLSLKTIDDLGLFRDAISKVRNKKKKTQLLFGILELLPSTGNDTGVVVPPELGALYNKISKTVNKSHGKALKALKIANLKTLRVRQENQLKKRLNQCAETVFKSPDRIKPAIQKGDFNALASEKFKKGWREMSPEQVSHLLTHLDPYISTTRELSQLNPKHILPKTDRFYAFILGLCHYRADLISRDISALLSTPTLKEISTLNLDVCADPFCISESQLHSELTKLEALGKRIDDLSKAGHDLSTAQEQIYLLSHVQIVLTGFRAHRLFSRTYSPIYATSNKADLQQLKDQITKIEARATTHVRTPLSPLKAPFKALLDRMRDLVENGLRAYMPFSKRVADAYRHDFDRLRTLTPSSKLEASILSITYLTMSDQGMGVDVDAAFHEINALVGRKIMSPVHPWTIGLALIDQESTNRISDSTADIDRLIREVIKTTLFPLSKNTPKGTRESWELISIGVQLIFACTDQDLSKLKDLVIKVITPISRPFQPDSSRSRTPKKYPLFGSNSTRFQI